MDADIFPLPDFEIASGTLKRLKRITLSIARGAGAFTLARKSRWRQRRLLILCYHGVSLHDEHCWDSDLFISPDRFARRMEILKRRKYNVLSLDEGLARLAKDDLPPASVAITFDDGLFCFYKTALPILESQQFTSVLYLTTYYSEVQEPVFNVACPYILWKARNGTLKTAALTGTDQEFDLAREDHRRAAWNEITRFVQDNRISASEKNHLMAQVSAQVGFDWERLRESRIFTLMTPVEVSDASRRGVSIELHTHRHRTPMDRPLFLREIDDNRQRIEAMTGRSPKHFCYPSGVYHPEFLPWLAERGVVSATTCDPGLTLGTTPPLLAPRLVDITSLNDTEFEGWLCGLSSLLPMKTLRH